MFSIVVLLLSLSMLVISIFQSYWFYNSYKKEMADFNRNVLFALNQSLDLYVINKKEMVKIDVNSTTGNSSFLYSETNIKNGLIFDSSYDSTITELIKEQKGNIKKSELQGVLMDSQSNLTRKSLTKLSVNDLRHIMNQEPVKESDKLLIDSLFQQQLNSLDMSLDFKILYGNDKPSTRSPSSDKESLSMFNPFVGPINLHIEQKERFVLGKMIANILSFFIVIIIMAGSSFYLISQYYKEKKLSVFKNDFVNNLAHELQTPITISTLVMEKMEMLVEESKLKHYVSICQKENEKLNNISNRILKLGELDNSNFSLNIEPMYVNKLIENLVNDFNFRLQDNDTIKMQLAPEQKRVNIDKLLFTEVIANLLDNAIKYSNSSVHILISTHTQNKKLQFLISDNGIGIKPEFKDKIFEPFFRVPHNNLHDVKGYGLGLSHVLKVIKKMKGTIEVESKPNKGTQFKIRIPYES